MTQLEKRKQYNHKALIDAFEILKRMTVGKTQGVRNTMTPSLDALTEILYAVHADVNEKELMKAEDPVDAFESQLRNSNIQWRRILLEDDWWRHTFGPLLGTYREKNKDGEQDFVALMPSWRGYKWFNPATERKEKVTEKTMEVINAEAFCFYPSLPQRPIDFRDIMKYILSSLYASDWCVVTLMTLIVTLLGLFLPFATKQIFDEVIPSGNVSGIIPIAILLIGVSITSVLFSTMRDILLTRMKDRSNANLQAALVSRTFTLPTPFFKKYPAGDLSRRIMVLSSLSLVFSNRTVARVLTALFAAIYLVQVFMYGHALLPVCLAILLAQLLFCYVHFHTMQKHILRVLPHIARTNGVVYSLLSSIQKIKTCGVEIRAFGQWAKYFEKSKYYTSSTPVFLKIAPAINVLIGVVGTGVMYYVAMKTHIALSDYFALTMAFAQITAAMTQLVQEVVCSANVQPDVELARPVMEAQPESTNGGLQIKNISGAISIRNLKFRYNALSPYLFDGLTMDIRAGEFVAIVGKSGVGKSTLMRLLLGFETPETGSIFYDHYDLRKLNKQSIRRCIGTCLQDGQLFAGDIMSNIAVTAPWSTEDDVWRAAQMAAIDADIKKMPQQLHTIITEGNDAGISGGQRQRLLIARALINKPAVLFMDEATSALDNITQDIVTKNIESTHCTRISIAHRLSTIRNADRIIVLDKGRVAEEGTYDELMERKGLFYDLSKRQVM